MNNQIVKFSAEPIKTRFFYLKMIALVVVLFQLFNIGAESQMRSTISCRTSAIVAFISSLVLSYFVTRMPLTQSLAIDYGTRRVFVEYMTLMKIGNLLEIPFDRLGVKTTPSADTTSATKWKMSLQLDGKEVYSLVSSESGFTPEQMNEFNERVEECQETDKN